MRTRPLRRSRGFTLVEILVGVGIGILGVIVMFRMVALFDSHTRSTSSGSDAQVAGTLAMFNLERDVKQAGMGFGRADAPFMGCAVNAVDGARVFNFPMVPVRIIPGAGGASDQIHTLYGDSSFYVEEQQLRLSTPGTKELERRGGFRPGDVAIVAGNETALPASAVCDLIEVTADNNPDNRTINHAVGAYTSFYVGASGVARYNGAVATPFATGRVYNLGPTPTLNIWQVRADGVLTRTNNFTAVAALDVAERVVNMQAEYGLDTNADQVVDTWTDVAPANWTTVRALRTAILVRSRQFERAPDADTGLPVPVTPTAANPCWATCVAANGHVFTMTNVDGGADTFGDAVPDANNWRYYRYRVYERVIPLRNMIWGTSS